MTDVADYLLRADRVHHWLLGIRAIDYENEVAGVVEFRNGDLFFNGACIRLDKHVGATYTLYVKPPSVVPNKSVDVQTTRARELVNQICDALGAPHMEDTSMASPKINGFWYGNQARRVIAGPMTLLAYRATHAKYRAAYCAAHPEPLLP